MELKFYKKVFSTNSLAKTIRPKVWTVIISETQTKGRGKGKRTWFSPKGGLYITVVLPTKSPDWLPFLNLAGGLAVAESLQSFKLSPILKWPNDVLIRNRKIAGILSENIIGTKTEFSIIGIGLNTNIDRFPQELRRKATSLKLEFREVDNQKLLGQIVNRLKKILKLNKEEIFKKCKQYGLQRRI